MWPSFALFSTPALSSAVTSPRTAYMSRSARRAAKSVAPAALAALTASPTKLAAQVNEAMAHAGE